VHCGYPLWGTWGNDSAERWIHEELYTGEFGPEARPGVRRDDVLFRCGPHRPHHVVRQARGDFQQPVVGYIARIEAAQKSDPDGFVGTNTQLTEDNHRWGANGGFLRMQHDVYNAGIVVGGKAHRG